MGAEWIGWFAGLGIGDRPTAGGKGASLGELTRAGIAVPPGFVVLTGAFDTAVASLERQAPFRAAVEALDPADLDSMATIAAGLRNTG